MADWKVFVTVRRRGQPVTNPSIIFGISGRFPGDGDGVVEIETEEIPLGREVYVPSVVVDGPNMYTLQRVFLDGSSYDVEVTSLGRYREPDAYSPPIP